ncbi:MAG: hypothetical protein AAF828_03750 [Bacteroidota bacterium]
MKQLLFFLLLTTTLFIASCGNDDGDGSDVILTPRGLACTNQAFTDAFNEAAMNLTTAINAYVADQSVANCEAYRAAADEYVDAVEDFADCALIDRDLYDQSIAEARQSVEDIDC